MPVYDLYHRRKKEMDALGETPSLLYDELPNALRTQLRQILRAAIGDYSVVRGYSDGRGPNNNDAWDVLVTILRRELGVDQLVGLDFTHYGDRSAEILNFLAVAPVDHALSAVELCCRYIETRKASPYDRRNHDITQEPKDALAEVNVRFRQANVGYKFEDGYIYRVDSEVLHAEVVMPALSLLRDKRFKGAEDEFHSALSKHRSGDDRGAITEVNCAFESAMKCICDIHNWKYDKRARASDLIKVLRAQGLFPDYLERSFDQLQAILGSGLPEVRNNEGSHGQGAQPKDTPAYVAAFAIHLAAGYIVYVCQASKALENKPSS